MTNYLKLIGLMVIVLICSFAVPASAAPSLYVTCIHGCGFSDSGYFTGYGTYFAEVFTICNPSQPETCDPDVDTMARVVVKATGCPSGFQIFPSRWEGVDGNNIVVNASYGTYAGPIAIAELHRSWLTGEVVDLSVQVEPTMDWCLDAWIELE